VDEFVPRRHRAVRKLLKARGADQMRAARQVVADVLRGLQREIRRRRRDGGREGRPGDARALQRPLLLGREAVDLCSDQRSETLGHPDPDVLEGTCESPAPARTREEAALGQVLEGGRHEQRIALRVPVDDCTQAVRHRDARRLCREILVDLGLGQRLQRNLPTQPVNQEILLERLQRMAGYGVHRTFGCEHQQLRGTAPPRQRREQIDGRGIDPLEIFEHQQQRLARREGLQRLGDLPQHAFARRAEEFALEQLAVLPGDEGGKLNQPRGGLRGEDPDDAVSPGSPTELPERLQHRVVGLPASVALDTLAARDATPHGGCSLALELVDEGGLADAGLSGDEDELTLVPQGLPQRGVQGVE
jgi:hypothetical protein